MSAHEQGALAAAAVEKMCAQRRAAQALTKIYRALVERGCKPEWTADGTGIVATCPCCREDRGLIVESATGMRPMA